MKIGLAEFIKSGFRLYTANGDTTYVGFLPPTTAPATAINLRWFNSLPGSVQAVTVDQNGQFGVAALGSGGSVNSVGLSAPNDIFTVSNSPVTVSGTLTLTKVSQTANTFFAAPNGSNNVPTFRSIVSADIPKTLDYTWITDFDTRVRTSRLDQLAVPTANLNINGFKLTGLADPTNAQDATTKLYVDSAISTGNNKGTVRVATTANINLASPGAAIDGVTLANGDLVLVKEQTTGAQNGLYVFNGAASAMTRATNADTNAEVRAGLFTFVSEGTTNGNNGYTLITDDPIVLGTTILTFVQSSGAGQIVDGNGLVKTGNVFDVVGTLNRILVNSNSVDIDSNYVGQTSITTLGTIGTGVWNGTTIAVNKGGTGGTDAATGRAGLLAAGITKGTFTSANLTSNILTITHSYNTMDLDVQVRDNNGKRLLPDDITCPNNTTINIDLTSYNTPTAISGSWGYSLTA